MAHVSDITTSNRSRWLWPLLVIVALVALSLTAVQPFLTGQMPLMADGELHLYRVIALDHSLRVDHPLWPRYSSGMVYGYGAPLFNYFPPLSYYPAHMLHLFGLSFQSAWLGSLVVFTLMAAGGAYLLGKSWSGRIGGLATAVAYVYAPYILFDTVSRGTSSEMAGLALLPWAMWGFRRLAVHGRRVDFALAVVAFAFFIPTHNIITLHGTALLALYALVLVTISEQKRRTFMMLALAGILAFAMTSFFWWPALAETDYVKINGIVDNLPQLNPANHLRSLGDVLALPRTADPTQMQPPTPIALGWPQLILGILGVVLAWVAGKRKLAGALLTFGVLVGVLVYLNLEASAWAWETLPLFSYTQFAWRVMGLPSLLLALMAGVAVSLAAERLNRASLRVGWLAGALAVMMVYAIPWLYTNHIPDYQADDIVDFQDMERRTGYLTGSSYAEYVSAWNQAPLDAEKLSPRFEESAVIPRLDPPEGVTIQSESWSGTAAELALTAEAETVLVFDWLYVPGWVADLDGESLAVEPVTGTGLVSVTIPAGEHSLNISLQPTNTQRTADIASASAAIVLIVILIVGKRYFAYSHIGKGIGRGSFSYSHFAVVIVLGVVILLLKVFVIDSSSTPLRAERYPQGPHQTPLQANFENTIGLIESELPSPTDSGQPTSVSLYWRLVGESAREDYSSVIHMRDSAGNIVIELGSFMPGGLATSNWLPGDYYIHEQIDFIVPCGTPPGEYTLEAGLYLPETQRRLDIINEAGNPVGVAVNLGTITVTHPDEQTITVPELDTAQEVALPGDYAVAGLPEQATSGDEINLLWDWVAVETPTQDYAAQLVWLDVDERVAAESPVVPLTLGFPSTQWRAGELWTGRHTLYVPGDLEAGRYLVGVQLVDSAGEPVGQVMAIDPMQVETPERVFDLPVMDMESGVMWENTITLAGYDLSMGEAGIDLSLYWQADTVIHESLRLFVHVLDADEAIIMLADSVPVEWTRPTTGWALGEVITTTYQFAVPEGDYRLRVGWYRPVDGVRIPLESGADSLVIP